MQFAAKMGFKTVAIARGADKGPLAKVLAWHKVGGKILYAQNELDRILAGGRSVSKAFGAESVEYGSAHTPRRSWRPSTRSTRTMCARA